VAGKLPHHRCWLRPLGVTDRLLSRDAGGVVDTGDVVDAVCAVEKGTWAVGRLTYRVCERERAPRPELFVIKSPVCLYLLYPAAYVCVLCR